MTKKTSPWVWVGVGCLTLVLLMGACVVGVGVWGFRFAKNMERGLSDPVLRDQKAREVLGCTALPEGYHAMLSLSVPFIVEMTMLSDREPDEKGQIHGFDRQGFIYIEFLKKMDPSVRNYFEGKSDDPSILRKQFINIDMNHGEVIERGTTQCGAQRCMFVAQRGSIQTDHGRSSGIQTVILIECPQDQKTRVGIWFGPEPAVDAEGAAVWKGTQADREAIAAFMAHFDLCPKNR